MAKSVDYFYDFSSPYAYLAHEEIERVAQSHGAVVKWRPFLLGGLFKTLGVQQAPILNSGPAKQNILMQDMFRWAEVRNLPFHWPANFPLNSVRPLRLMCQVEGAQHAALAGDLFRQYWGLGTDISTAAVLEAAASCQGLDATALLAGCDSPEVKQRLIANTTEAAERGMCGAPSFFVGDQLVWGQDRLDFVARLLTGWVPRGPD